MSRAAAGHGTATHPITCLVAVINVHTTAHLAQPRPVFQFTRSCQQPWEVLRHSVVCSIIRCIPQCGNEICAEGSGSGL